MWKFNIDRCPYLTTCNAPAQVYFTYEERGKTHAIGICKDHAKHYRYQSTSEDSGYTEITKDEALVIEVMGG
jgi:hypothetical protein